MRNRARKRLIWVCAWAGLAFVPHAASVLAAPAKKAAAPTPPTPVDPAAEAARRAEVVAKFDSGQITVGELEDAIAASNPLAQGRALDQAALKALLDRSLRFELLAAEAQRRGYDKNQSVVQSVKQNAVQAMIKKDVDDKLTLQSIAPEAIKKYYDEHLDEFVRPELRRASQILFATEADAKALLAEAKAADMRGFRELARLKSADESSKLRGGDLRYFSAKGKPEEAGPDIDPATAKATFTLKVIGDTTGIVKTDGGFVILKLTGLRPGHEDTLKDAEERIRRRLWREQREAAIDSLLAALKQQLKPITHPELIDAIKFNDNPPVPPGQGLPSGFPHTKPPPVPMPQEK